MANYLLVIPSLLEYEGGLSKDPHDNASAYPVPDGSGYHTNKGVTWQTFTSLASQLGYSATPALFYEMPKEIWGKIFKKGYWDKILGDKINSQGLANILVNGAYLGTYGLKNQVKAIQEFLKQNGFNVAVDGWIGTQTISAINSYATTADRTAKLLSIAREAQLNYLSKLDDWWKYKDGWTNRFNDLYNNGISLINAGADFVKKKPVTVALFTIGALVAGYFIIQKIRK